jgi:hypothetical protein
MEYEQLERCYKTVLKQRDNADTKVSILTLALENIMSHQLIIGGDNAKKGAVWKIANNALNYSEVHEITELKKDKTRIDWLSDATNNIGNVQLPTECVLNNIHSLRSAIDEAMALSG